MSMSITTKPVPKTITVEIDGKLVEVILARELQGWIQHVNDTLKDMAARIS